jgi:hypothetical protein
MDLDLTAKRQHRVVTTQQALAAGLTEDAISWRVASGRWRHVAAGLYAVGPDELDWWGRASAALLRAGPDSALTLLAAGYALGFESRAPSIITVGVPRNRHVTRLPGTRVSRRIRLVRTTARRLSVTGGAFTVADLAGRPGTTWRDAIAGAARAVQAKAATPEEVAAEVNLRKRLAHRRALLGACGWIAAGAESGLEVEFLDAVVIAHGLPAPRIQVPAEVGSRSVRRDAEFQEFGLVVELDGELGHVGDAVASDRRRDRKTTATGRVTMRLGYGEVTMEACDIAGDLAAALTSRGWRGLLLRCGGDCGLGTAPDRAA